MCVRAFTWIERRALGIVVDFLLGANDGDIERVSTKLRKALTTHADRSQATLTIDRVVRRMNAR